MNLFTQEQTEIRPTDIKLRGYQLEAVDAIRQEFVNGTKATLLVLPTGTGKTFVGAWIARQAALKGGRTLVLAHRGELIEQFHESLIRMGLDTTIEKADQYARAFDDPHAVVATVQTMQRERLASWPVDYFKIIITDEAHHATADTYQRIYEHFTGCRHLGITATADRSDETFLGEVYESVAYELSLWDAMTAPEPGPYLCRLKFVQCDVGIDLRDIRTTGGDLNQADLEEAIRPYIDTLANAIKKEIGDRPTIVFTPDVGSATAMASALQSLNINAQWVSGDNPNRKGIVKAYKAGEFQVLCNCALVTEGFDAPETAAIVLCRPTKSRPLFAQMAGRGTRLKTNGGDCLLVDFNWLTEKHKLVKAVELFDSTHQDSEILGIAEEILKAKTKDDPTKENSANGVDLVEAFEQAQEEQIRRKVLRVKARERELKYKKVSYDPISIMEAFGVPVRKEAKSLEGTATEKQKDILRKFKVDHIDGLSRTAARRLLDQLFARSHKNLATYKQVLWLNKLGIDPIRAQTMTFKEASMTLDAFWGKKKN